jgi:hypothetical protein
MDYLAGPLLDMSFRDQDFDDMASSPFPADSRDRRNMRIDLGYAEDESSEASTSSFTDPRSSSRRADSRTASEASDTESTDLSSAEECRVFFGKKTDAEKMYLRKLQPGTPSKSSNSPARQTSSPRIVRKRDSREFHRRKTMVFSKKDRFSLSVQAGNEGRGQWDVVSDGAGREGEFIAESDPLTLSTELEEIPVPSSQSSPSPLTSLSGPSENLDSAPSSSTLQDITLTVAVASLHVIDDVDEQLSKSTTAASEALAEDSEEDENDEIQSESGPATTMPPLPASEDEVEEERGMISMDQEQSSDQDADRHVDKPKPQEEEVQLQELESAPEQFTPGSVAGELVEGFTDTFGR